MRPNIFTALLVAAVALAACLFAAGAHAQRGGAQRQAGDNAAQGERPKRVVVGRGSETQKGSRLTVTADDSLKDYRAYRSGDRFYVVLPKSAAGAGARGSGRGYTDMQVEQRGDSVVLSYRVQPGAKSRVEQRFNRLEVIFEVPEGGQQSASTQGQTNAGRATQPPPAENRNAAPANRQASQTQTTPQSQNAAGAAERRPATAESARNQAAEAANAGQPSVVIEAPPAGAAQGVEAPPSSTTEQPQETAAPAASPSAEPQVAQAQPPAAVAPITTTEATPNAQASGSSLGTFLLRNWALALIFAVIVFGVGLLIAARRTSTQPKPLDADSGGPHALDEPRARPLAVASTTTPAATAAPLSTSTTAATAAPASTAPPAATTTPAAAELDAVGEPSLDAAPLAAATALAGGAAVVKSRKQSRKEARRKKKGGRAPSVTEVDENAAAGAVAEPASEETAVGAPAVEETTPTDVEATVAVEGAAAAAVEETAAPVVEETTAAVEVSELKEAAAEARAPEPSTVESEVSAAEAVEVSRTEEALDAAVMEPAAPSAEVETPSAAAETLEAAPAETEAVGVAPVEPEAVVEHERAIEPAAVEETPAEVAAAEAPQAAAEEAAPEAVAPVAEIVPAFAPDQETVQAETRRLFEGEAYDRAVVGTRDPVARQMIAAELLSVLAGRNAERRKRAGAAFVEQGFFDETARDLREADAPAERAAAARSLALLGERSATPHLVAALQDPSIDVRRAAVEALGALRDPAAVAPLESLLERERNERNRIPGRIVLNAIQTCREGSAEVTAEAPATAPAVETHEPVTAVESVTAVEPVTVSEPAPEAEVSSAVEPAAGDEVETSRLTEAPAESAPPDEVTVETPSASTAEVTPYVPGEEDAAPAAPLVEERGLEPLTEAAQEDSRAEEEETLAAEAETFVGGEAPAVSPHAHAFAEDLQAAAESHSLESAAVEQQSVVETGIRPFAEHEEVAEETTEEAHGAAVEAVASSSAEVGVEPFVEPAEEAAPQFVESAPPSAEATQPALFDTDAAEVTRDIEPVRAAEEEAEPPAGEVVAGEWFDLDVNEFHGAGSPAATDARASEPSSHAEAFDTSVFESSSGEAIGAHDIAEASHAAAESEHVAAQPSETARELDYVESHEAVTAPLRSPAETREPARASGTRSAEKGIAPLDEYSAVPAAIQHRLASEDPSVRAAAVVELSHVDTDEAFQQICAAFDDRSEDVRSAAARALYGLRPERADSFTRALREATPERRRQIGASISSSGLAGEAVSQLTGESREKTYEAFSLLFLMAKAGEVQPLVRAIESHPSNDVRLAVVKLLALSGQKEILPAFRRLAVRGSLPTEVRSAVMEAIYQISSSQPTPA